VTTTHEAHELSDAHRTAPDLAALLGELLDGAG
jgi:hypothetical protein